MLKYPKPACALITLYLITVSNAVLAGPAAGPLPFEDGSLLALATSCLVGLVWLVRSKRK